MAIDLNVSNIDIKRVETWPAPLRYLTCLVVAVVVVVLSWFLVTEDQSNSLEKLEKTEGALRSEYIDKARVAVNLDQYIEQKIELESKLESQLRQLPNNNEVANLLDDISFIAQDNGLQLISIKWEPEIKQEIYTELPMSIQVTGTYEQLGKFTEDLSALPRIVTMAKFDLEHVGGKDAKPTNELLDMKMLAKTYRYNEEEATKARERADRRNKRRGGR